MSTVTQIGWHAKYQEAVRELHALRLENDQLKRRLLKVSPERDALAKRLVQVKISLKDALKCLA